MSELDDGRARLVERLVEEALIADEVTSADAARNYVRFVLEGMNAGIGDETRAAICEQADRRIGALVPDSEEDAR